MEHFNTCSGTALKIDRHSVTFRTRVNSVVQEDSHHCGKPVGQWRALHPALYAPAELNFSYRRPHLFTSRIFFYKQYFLRNRIVL